MGGFLKLLGAGVLLIIVVGVIGASGSKQQITIEPGRAAGTIAAESSSQAVAQAKVGDTVKSGNWSYTVTKVDRMKTLVWSDFGNKTDALGQWLIVSMTLRNIGNQNFPINTFDFQLTDGGGTKYDTSSKFEVYSYMSHAKLTNLGEQFPPGIDVKTALVFDINPAATGLKLVLKQANSATIALE